MPAATMVFDANAIEILRWAIFIALLLASWVVLYATWPRSSSEKRQ